MDLIGDIGATNTRLALLDDRGRTLAIEFFKNNEFSSLDDVLRTYLVQRRASDHPKRAALAVAAAIVGDDVAMVNRGWSFSQAKFIETFGLSQLTVVNDFAAIAWALPNLHAQQIHQIGGGARAAQSPLAALGPGSGLGVSSIVPFTDAWAVAQGEGGHATLPAMTDEEAAAIDLIRDEYGHCSAERVLSGPGLVNLYQALAQMAGRGTPTATPQDVTALAHQGEPLARRTRAMFFAMLGTVAGNLALTVGARGGVYIAGGIIPRFIEAFEQSEFRSRFEAKGRYRWYMERIPTYVITEPLPAFIGLRRLLGYR